MVATTFAEISRYDLNNPPIPNAKVTGLRHVASYNWIESSVPTILVPGSPPLWCPPQVPPKLSPDSGMVYIDQNAARHPNYPLEPLFRALFSENPNFEIREVDLVTDRNNIRKLLRFVQASSSDPFRIEIEVAGGNTIVFTRMEARSKENIQGFKGFGHSFEKAYTKKPATSAGYHRIVGYDFGGIKCLIRHETDGSLGDGDNSVAVTKIADAADSLSDVLGTLTISEFGSTPNKVPEIVVTTGGKVADVSSTLEIKTRAMTRTLDMAEVAPQLWISQTPNLAVGYHRNGVFSDVRVRNMKQYLQDWEAANQATLCKLAFLVRKIITVVKDCGSRTVSLRYDGGTKITITSSQQKQALPDDLYSLWDAKKQEEGLGSQAGTTAEDSSKGAEAPDTQPNPSVHNSTPHAEVINDGLRKGFRHFFRLMPTHLSDYHSLCNSLNSRAVDVLEGRNLRDIMSDMRRGKGDWDPDERREIPGLKTLARDSAFRLLYMFVLGEPESELRDKNKAYNAALFAVSHPRIFKYKTRKMVRAAFEERFQATDKQRKELNKWLITDPGRKDPRESEDDATTEAEDIDFDSDWSF